MSEFAQMLHLQELALGTLNALGTIALMFIPIAYLEHRQGAAMSRYLTRRFVHDLLYCLFYRSGAFALLGAAMTAELLMSHLRIIQFNLLEGLPLPVAALLFWFLADFFAYWVHRAQHAVPVFWQFHAVHHATEELTFVSAYRLHPLEQIVQNTVMVVPLLLLGVPPHLWFPFALLQIFFDLVQHAQLDWKYGALYRVFVSPVFHRIHHSPERLRHDRNYAKVLSLWDHIFGTADPERAPPREYGVEGLPSEPTLAGQFLGPFRRIFDRSPGRELSAALEQGANPAPPAESGR